MLISPLNIHTCTVFEIIFTHDERSKTRTLRVVLLCCAFEYLRLSCSIIEHTHTSDLEEGMMDHTTLLEIL